MAKLSSYDQEHMAHKSKIFTIWPFTRKVCQTLSRDTSNELSVIEEGDMTDFGLTLGRLPLLGYLNCFYNFLNLGGMRKGRDMRKS